MSVAAVIQMTSGPDVQQNMRTAFTLLEEAAQRGAKLAALPENFLLMGMTEQDKFSIAEDEGQGPIQQWLVHTARQLNLWIVAGTIPLKVPHESRLAAACLVVNAQGEVVARYDKIHLFDVDVEDATGQYRESATLRPGQSAVLVDTPIGKVGLAICYDMRFPELFRQLSAAGAEVLIIPAAFTVPTGKAHWDVLLRARAVENLCYVLAPAQSGVHANGRETYGHSMMINPWGEVIVCKEKGVGVIAAEIDLNSLHERRRKFPALTHRRL